MRVNMASGDGRDDPAFVWATVLKSIGIKPHENANTNSNIYV